MKVFITYSQRNKTKQEKMENIPELKIKPLVGVEFLAGW